MNITAIKTETHRLRCRHCHLTIKAEDLMGGYCPECFEADHRRRYDFETLTLDGHGEVRYRCEDCGAVLHPD